MESIPFFRTWLAKTIGHANDKCSSGSGCKATDPHGPRVRAGADCVFPFKYRGVLHSACTLSGDHKQPWCSTKTDDNYEHKSGTWATCALTCPTEVSKIKLVDGKNEWEGNIMVGGKPVCDDGAKKHGKAAAQVVCRFIFFWSISSQKFTITIIFLDAVACQMSTMSKCPNVRCKKICPDSVEISPYQSRSNEICLMMSIKLS